MAATKYKGLTVEIGGTTTKLANAIRNFKAQATQLRGQLSMVSRLLEFNPASTELLAQKQRLLGQALATNAAQYTALKQKEAAYHAQVGPHTEQEIKDYKRLQSDLLRCKLQYEQLKAQAIEFGAAASTATLAARGRMQALQNSLRSVSSGFLAVGAGAAILGALSLKSAISFEQAFADVRKTIIATDEEYAKLAEDIRQMALIKPVTPEDLAYIESLGGQLNIATQHLTKFTSTIADLDVATDMNLEDASLQLARFSNIAGMSQGDIDRLGATIVDLGNNSATTESQIMNMAMRIVGSASNIGMSAPNVLGLATALSSVGIQAEMGGNAISTIMNRIDKDVALSSNTLQVWASTAGMSAQEFKRYWESDVTGALISVVKGMGTFRDEGNNLNLLLKDMGINYMRQIDTMQRLSRTGDLLTEAFQRSDTAWDQNIALAREASQRYETAESKLKMMQNAFNELGITIGNEILPCFKDIVVGISGAVRSFADMDDGTKQLIVSLLGIATVGGLGVKGLELMLSPAIKLVSAFASLKTSLAFYVAEQTVATAATSAHAEAVAADAVAEELDAAAKRDLINANVEEMASQNMVTVAKNAATIASTKLAAALGIESALAAGLVGILGIAAVGALVGLSVAFVNASRETKRYTKASQEAAQSVRDAQSAYDRAVEEHGELSDEALRAKAALEEERAAFDASAETIEEFCERMRDTVEAHEQMKGTISETSNEANNSAGSILHLAQQIEELASAENRDEAAKARLTALTQSLGGQVEGLGNIYDATTDSLLLSTEAINSAAKAEADRLRADAALENLTNLYAEQAQIESDLAETQEELKAASEGMPELLDMEAAAYQANAAGATDYSNAQDELQRSYAECTEEIQKQEKVLADINSKSIALEKATDSLRAGTMSAADAASYYSRLFDTLITEEEVLRQEELRLAEAELQRSSDVADLVTELEKLEAENGALVTAIANSGMTLDEFAEKMVDCGISADDLAKGLEDMSEKTSDAFNKIEYESDLSLNSMISTLEGNIEKTRSWGDNMAKLYEKAGSESQKSFVKYIGSLGVEYAPIVDALLKDTSGKFERLSSLYAEAGQDAPVAFLKGIGMLPSEVASAMGMTEQEAQAAFDRIESGAAESGEATTRALADNISGDAAKSAMEAAADQILGPILQLPDEAGEKAQPTGSEIADGILSQSDAAAAAADTISKLVADHFSSASLDAWWAGSNMTGVSFRDGLDSGRGAAVAAADTASKQVADHLSSANGDAWWAGYNMMMGMARGIAEGRSNVIQAARSAVSEAMEAAKSEAEINSPSRKWRRIIGWGLMEGGAAGIKDKTSLMVNAAVSSIKVSQDAAMKQTESFFVAMQRIDNGRSVDPVVLSRLSKASPSYIYTPSYEGQSGSSYSSGNQINNEWNITTDDPEKVAALVAVRERRYL